jgi:hypothetical protein
VLRLWFRFVGGDDGGTPVSFPAIEVVTGCGSAPRAASGQWARSEGRATGGRGRGLKMEEEE